MSQSKRGNVAFSQGDEKLTHLIARLFEDEMKASIEREIRRVIRTSLTPRINKAVRQLLSPGRN